MLVDDAERLLNYQFRDPQLLTEAVTHASSAGHRLESNERLEFLGDAVLGFVVCEYLFATYPSLLEGFGMPVLEALAQGTPVVTSSGTATEEVVGDAGYVVDPSDLDGLAQRISELVTDDRRHAALSEAGRARAETFTWAATAEQTAAAYEDALG